MGAQRLMSAQFSISATDRMGTPYSDSIETPFGVRTVTIQRAKDEAGESFVPLVNGHPIFCRGANWIPTSMLPAAQSEAQLRVLVAAAASAGMNCLRVWGGGIYEPELFYALCDRLAYWCGRISCSPALRILSIGSSRTKSRRKPTIRYAGSAIIRA
jgi:hypothetical protein